MATDTTDKVQEGASIADQVDFNEIAASLGVQFKTPEPEAKTEEKPAEPKTDEPSETTEDTSKPEADAAGEGTEEEDAAAEESEQTAEEGETDEEGEGTESEEPAAAEPTKVQQRIDKLTAQKREALEQLDALKAELEAAKAAAEKAPPVILKDPENPLSSLTDASAVEAEVAKAQAVLDWSDDHREGASVTINGEEKYFDADAIKEIRANARKLLKAAPKQQEYIRIREATLPEARTFYPEFFQPGTTAHQFLQATLQQYPTIVQFPNWELIVGDAFAGQQLRMARVEQMQKKRASADATKKAPAKEAAGKVPKTPTPSASPKVSSSSSAAMRQRADAALKAGGDRDALTAFVESIV